MEEPRISNRLPREERLRGLTTVSKLFANGESGFSFPIRYVWSRGCDTDTSSILFTVPKRFHKRANRRNTLRRRVKEAYRLNNESMPKGLNVALIYSTKEVLEYSRIERAITKVIEQISKEVEQ